MTDQTESQIGDNSEAILDGAIKDIKSALGKIRRSNAKSLDDWVDYGRALNIGREVFASNDAYGKWLRKNGLDTISKDGAKAVKVNGHEQVAAQWAAGNPDQFEQMKTANPNVTTVRGLHKKWKQHVATLVASKALHEVEDAAEAAADIEALSQETGIETGELDKAREDAIRKFEAAEARRKKQEEEAEAQREALRAELEADLDLAVEPSAPDTALVDGLVAALTFALVEETASVLLEAMTFTGTVSMKKYDHGSMGVHFAQADLAKSSSQLKDVLAVIRNDLAAGEVSEPANTAIRTLAVRGEVLPGAHNPPSETADLLPDTFATQVIDRLRALLPADDTDSDGGTADAAE